MLISFRIDLFDLAVQGTLKSLLQHHSSEVSILHCSAFFRVQLSHQCMTTGEQTNKQTNIALTIKTSKVWSFSFSISPSNEYSGLISFRIDWFDLDVQGTLNNLLQHHSSKASILQHSAFFMVQLSYLYFITLKFLFYF